MLLLIANVTNSVEEKVNNSSLLLERNSSLLLMKTLVVKDSMKVGVGDKNSISLVLLMRSLSLLLLMGSLSLLLMLVVKSSSKLGVGD